MDENGPKEAPPPYSRYPDDVPAPKSRNPPELPPRPQQPQPQPLTNLQEPKLPSTPRQFPPAWTLYRGQMGQMFLGENSETPLYAISRHSGFSGQPEMVLHNGPSETLPPLATGERDLNGPSSCHSVIMLPPLQGARSIEEKLWWNMSWPHVSYTFDVEVGTQSGALTRESFEWRHSAGAAVGSLGSVASSGWKLIRLAVDAPPGVGPGWQFVGGGETSSDGKEIVAVWAPATMSMSKVLKFRFIGTGASGTLGERWAVMAVMTALRMWQRAQRNS